MQYWAARVSALLRIGWVAWAADCAYWLWELRQPEEQQLSRWHAVLNIFLFYGGILLFFVLLLVSYLDWRTKRGG